MMAKLAVASADGVVTLSLEASPVRLKPLDAF
jgi:hypothetical protein